MLWIITGLIVMAGSFISSWLGINKWLFLVVSGAMHFVTSMLRLQWLGMVDQHQEESAIANEENK